MPMEKLWAFVEVIEIYCSQKILQLEFHILNTQTVRNADRFPHCNTGISLNYSLPIIM